MTWQRWMTAATGACALAMAGGAQSAPLGSAASDFKAGTTAGSGFERVAYRLCWREGGARQCRWVDNARIYGDRASRPAPRAYGYRNPRYVAPRAYGFRARPVYGYVAPRVFYAADPEFGYGPPGAFAYQAPVFGYQAPVTYGLGPIVRSYRPSMDYANPDAYPSGTPAWWSVMNRENRSGQPQ